MNKQRPVIYNVEGERGLNIPIAKQENKPMNVIKKDSRESNKALTLHDIDFNEDIDENIVQFVNKQLMNNQPFMWQGREIIGFNWPEEVVEYKLPGKGRILEMPINYFIREIRHDIKIAKKDLKLKNLPIEQSELFRLLDQDIKYKRPFNRKVIIKYDDFNVYFEDGTKTPLASFLEEYGKARELIYDIPAGLVENQEELQRAKNIEDMATAFKMALGIKEQGVKTYKENENRNVSSLRTTLYNTRDPSYTWTTEELKEVYNKGIVSNPTTRVSGDLNNTFDPYKPDIEYKRESAGLKAYYDYKVIR